MSSTYLAGVFLTIYTYDGPQLVYHYYDESLANGSEKQESSEASEEFEWSEEDSIEEDISDSSFQPFSESIHKIPSHNGNMQISRTSVRSGIASAMPTSFSKAVTLNSNQTHGLKGLAASRKPLRESTPESSSSATSKSIADTKDVPVNSSVTTNSFPLNDHYEERRNPYPCGLDEDILAEILTPPEIMSNEKFSLSVDNCMFVGIPVYILDTGTWRPLKHKQDMKEETVKDDSKSFSHDGATEGGEHNANATNTKFNEPRESGTTPKDRVTRNDGDKSQELENHATESTAQSHAKGVITDKDSPMRMFHVSFALIPPMTKASECEERIYHSILVPFMRMLRQEQASRNYVWHEVAKILKIQERNNHLSMKEQQEAAESVSELALALRNMCTAISNMDIARIIIGGKARTFQVPLKLELEQLPNWYEEISPHSYVNTSNSSDKEITHDNYSCYGLLLLDDPEVIVQEINVDPQGPVAAMIRNIHPTSSLEELSKSNNIEINQIVNLVWSLVYWRRARIIIPLHAKYTYGVSPLAPRDSQFQQVAKTYHSLFPMMPSLPRMLALLSTGKPKPFSMHIPSNDHVHIYMQTLSWLLQNDFVVHLATFALVVITKKIKLSAINVEEIIDGGNVSGVSEDEDSRPNVFIQRNSSSYRELEDVQDSVIQDPRHTSPIEKRWLGQVALSGASRNPDMAALFQKLVKYLNGKDCLEQVMIYEKISREDMRKFIQEFSQYIVTYKHW